MQQGAIAGDSLDHCQVTVLQSVCEAVHAAKDPVCSARRRYRRNRT
jgi:hypothetical protein